PAGVTLDSTTGLFMGTPAAGTAGSWPVTIKAENGIGAGATQAFSLKVTSTITSFTVSKGVAQRSYIRYLDLGMDSNASALALLNNPSRVQLTKANLNGVGSAPVSLSGFLSVPAGQSTLAVNFGTIGLGNSRNTSTADGYYTLSVDLDGNGSFDTNLFFFRLFGDINGDREVTTADQSAVLAGCTAAYNANLDLNGDGVVNTSDFQYVKKSVGKKLKSTLIVTS
ncbi:MAG: putative Ig domain-containing protein, partial [Planctomycetota bacterium]|nr:putative Ig domain-containing protein [Planctomycetota bacterium]